MVSPTPVDWSQFSDSVMLQVTRPKEHKLGNTICTGVVTQSQVVLTTAHCADGAEKITVIFDVENGADAKLKQTVTRKRITMHPDYRLKQSLYANDLAILHLKDAAPIDVSKIRKIPATPSLRAGERLMRIGMGLRNGKNTRTFTDPVFVKIPSPGVFEASDVNSYFGDSGGPIYNSNHELIAIHSTLDDFNGKSIAHTYSVYLPDYHEWLKMNEYR